MPIYRRIDEIDKAFLQSLVEEEVMEDRGIEYKRDLNILIDLPKDVMERGKQEFCGDVSAFANTDGGFLIYGIDQDVEGRANELNGISCLDNFDKLRNRLFQIIGAGIEPQLFGVDIEKVDLDKERSIILIHVPSSWSKPHWVGKKGCRTFYTRTSSGKDHLDIRNVRELFVLSETAIDRVHNFRSERIAAINDDAIPVYLHEWPKAVLHVVPFSSIVQNKQLDLPALTRRLDDTGKSKRFSDFRFNFEGIYYGPRNGQGAYYYQVFRNGCVEFTECIEPNNEKELYAPYVENFVWDACLPRVFEWYDTLGVVPPLFFMLSLLNIRGCKLVNWAKGSYLFSGRRIDGFHEEDIHSIDDKVDLPISELKIERYEQDADKFMSQLRPAFDMVWQSSGWPHSPGFDDDDNWLGWNNR